MGIQDLSLIERREIEALVAVPLIEGFAEAIGIEKSVDAAKEVIRGLAREAGRRIAAERQSNQLADLCAVVETLWARNGEVLQIKFIERSETSLIFNVLRCGYADKYEELGMKDFGYCLSCSRDAAFVEGFNPKFKMIRTQTIMEGAPFCDFKFVCR